MYQVVNKIGFLPKWTYLLVEEFIQEIQKIINTNTCQLLGRRRSKVLGERMSEGPGDALTVVDKKDFSSDENIWMKVWILRVKEACEGLGKHSKQKKQPTP